MECNGYCHRYYDETEEKVREKLITQKGILQAKPGKMVKLYDLEQLGQEMPFYINPLNL